MGKTSIPVKELPAHNVMVSNVLKVYSFMGLNSNVTWYQDANDLMLETAIEHGLSIESVCGIFAAMSPQLSWERNKLEALQFCEHGLLAGGYMQSGANLLKADRIRSGENPLHVLGGNKVLSFYDNLLRPDDSRAVTVDRHAVKIAMSGIHFNSTGLRASRTVTDKAYHLVADAYRNAARLCGLMPHQIQSATWGFYAWADGAF